MFEIQYSDRDGCMSGTGQPCLLERLDRAGYKQVYGGEPCARPANLAPYSDAPAGYQFWKTARGEIRAIADSGALTHHEFHAARKG